MLSTLDGHHGNSAGDISGIINPAAGSRVILLIYTACGILTCVTAGDGFAAVHADFRAACLSTGKCRHGQHREAEHKRHE